MTHLRNKKGITIIEVLVGVSILTVVSIYMFHTITLLFASASDIHQKGKALFIAQEGMEMVRYMRDEDWVTFSGLSVDTPYYIEVTDTVIAATTTAQTVDGAVVSFVLREVYRNGSDDVVASTTSGAVVDTGSREVYVEVQAGNVSSSFTSLLTNILSS